MWRARFEGEGGIIQKKRAVLVAFDHRNGDHMRKACCAQALIFMRGGGGGMKM